MTYNERRKMAFLAGMMHKLACGQCLTDNEIQQLDNIASELGFDDLAEDEFRYYNKGPGRFELPHLVRTVQKRAPGRKD